MKTVEILAGSTFSNAVTALGLTSAMLTYHYHPAPKSYREDYQVWLLSKDDFDNICAIDADDWKDDWGWWRHCPGSNMGSPLNEYIIRGRKIVAWDGIKRELYFQTCLKCPDYYRHCGEHYSPNNACFASYEEQAFCLGPREYKDIIDYFNNEIGVSTEKNICALSIHLAQINDLTLSELFKKYLGGEIKMETIKVRYLSDKIPPLEYIDGKSDWIDLRAADSFDLKAGEFKLIPLGVAMQLPQGYEAHIIPRSSTFKNFGIIQANHMGLVDESYCGDNDQWFFPALAMRDTHIEAGDRICQFRIEQHQPKLVFEVVDTLGNTDRGGIGSTGKR